MRVTARRATRRHGVRALKRERERRSGRQAFVRVETCGRCGHGRRCYVNSHVGSDAIKSCNAFFARTSIDSQVYARVFFCVFYTRANSLRIPGFIRVLVTSSPHTRSGGEPSRVLFPPGASLVSDLVARERGDFPEAGGCLARASLGSARATARIPRSRLAECSFSLPETGGPPRSPHLSLRRTRAACASEQRNGGRLRRQSGATPSDRARSLDLTPASRRARHLAHATRVEDAPTQFARRTALLVAPTFRHRRRWKNFARARRRGREGKEIIADEPGQNHG